LNSEKQKVLIESLISSASAYTTCHPILEGKYFDPEYSKAIIFIKKYYEKHHNLPAPDIIKAESGLKLNLVEVDQDRENYTIIETEKFCKHKALEKAVLKAADYLEIGDGGKIQEVINEALLVTLNRNLGLRYFEDPEARLKRMLESPPVIPTGIDSLDELLFGGYSRKELLLVSANSGGGKSITLSNLGFNALHLGYNILYVSLELSEDIVAQRFDTMITGVSRKNWQSEISKIITGVRRESEDPNMGVLDIIQMRSGTNSNNIRSYLNEFCTHHNQMPDVIILDYVDKMSPNQKNFNSSDVWSKDKYCSEQLRDIGVDHNAAMLTASQLNREAIKTGNHDHSHIAGGISKINECDIYWSIRMDDAMRAQGLCDFKLQKTRNSDGVGNTVNLTRDPIHLRILDKAQDDSKTPLFQTQKENINKDNDSGRSVSDELKGNGLLDLVSDISDSLLDFDTD